MMEKTREYRKELAELFLNVLEEKQLDWKQEWAGSNAPVNAKSKAKYRGINRLRLMLVAMKRGYQDSRWATFKQIQDLGCRLKNAKGQGVTVEYWFPYDLQEKHTVSWDEFREKAGGEPDERYTLRAVYSTVFNASVIEGLPAIEREERLDISMEQLVSTLSGNMAVEIMNDGGEEAFYRPSEDKIHLPKPEAFFSQYAYNATALHELAHATGAPHRLNRDMENFFGSQGYAYEELIAEISSCFFSEHLSTQPEAWHLKNHQAYVQSWIQSIREKPETLVKAVAEAEKAASYMEYKAQLIPQKEYEKVAGSVKEVPEPDVEKEQEPGQRPREKLQAARQQLELRTYKKKQAVKGPRL